MPNAAIAVSNFLGSIMYYCQQHQLLPLTVIVVNQTAGRPGEGLIMGHTMWMRSENLSSQVVRCSPSRNLSITHNVDLGGCAEGHGGDHGKTQPHCDQGSHNQEHDEDPDPRPVDRRTGLGPARGSAFLQG